MAKKFNGVFVETITDTEGSVTFNTSEHGEFTGRAAATKAMRNLLHGFGCKCMECGGKVKAFTDRKVVAEMPDGKHEAWYRIEPAEY